MLFFQPAGNCINDPELLCNALDEPVGYLRSDPFRPIGEYLVEVMLRGPHYAETH